MAMTQEEFEASIVRAVESIPAKFRKKIKNVAILAEDEPSAQTRREQGLHDNETLLGLYRGVPAIARGEGYGVGPTLPDTITLFKNPIENEAGNDPTQVERVIRETIWHEYAHYFGMDETMVRKWEQGHNKA